jgi:DNA-damage-inducible protein D
MRNDIIGELSITHKQLTLITKDFANELTRHNVIEKNLNTPTQMLKEHRENNKALRDILLQRGVRPEALPPAEDVKKLETRLDSDEKKAAKGSK